MRGSEEGCLTECCRGLTNVNEDLACLWDRSDGVIRTYAFGNFRCRESEWKRGDGWVRRWVEGRKRWALLAIREMCSRRVFRLRSTEIADRKKVWRGLEIANRRRFGSWVYPV